MIKLVFCCRRKPEMTREEFLARWLDVHGPLVRRLREDLPMMKRYVQSHSLPDEISEAVRASRGAGPAYDGITEVWFDDLGSMGGDGSEAALAAGRARRGGRAGRPGRGASRWTAFRCAVEGGGRVRQRSMWARTWWPEVSIQPLVRA